MLVEAEQNKKGLAAARGKTAGRSPKSFMRKVRRSAIRVGTRDVVIATYHNIGMLDWATLFWGWLSLLRVVSHVKKQLIQAIATAKAMTWYKLCSRKKALII